MAPVVYQLLGFPGAGKYTVAQAMVALLAEGGEPAALLDNHATANLVWSLVPAARRFDDDVMARMNQLRMVLLDAAAELTGPDHSIVFTNFVPAGRSTELLERHRQLADRLRRPFVAVVLRCATGRLLQRVSNPDRAARMKLVDRGIAQLVVAAGMAVPEWPDLHELDVTDRSPDDVAAEVVRLGDLASPSG